MTKTLHERECYCDACGKLIYKKDLNKRAAQPADFYEIKFDHFDSHSTIGGSTEPSEVYYKTVCSEKCIREIILPEYFSRVSAKGVKLQNTEGVAIRHYGSI